MMDAAKTNLDRVVAAKKLLVHKARALKLSSVRVLTLIQLTVAFLLKNV